MPPPAPSLVRALERAEVVAWSDFAAAAAVDDRARLGIVAHPEPGGGVLALVPAIDTLALNRAFGWGLGAPITAPRLADLVATVRAAGAPRVFFQLAPGALPADADDLLAAAGFAPYNRWVKLHRPAGGDAPPTPDPAAPGVTVRAIGRADARTFGELLVGAFEWSPDLADWIAAPVGRPGWTHYLADLEGRPAGTAATFLAGDTAWLDFASTHPGARGRGVQRALIARRIADATAAGARHLVVEAGEQRPGYEAVSYRNLKRMGFGEAYFRPNYLLRLTDG